MPHARESRTRLQSRKRRPTVAPWRSSRPNPRFGTLHSAPTSCSLCGSTVSGQWHCSARAPQHYSIAHRGTINRIHQGESVFPPTGQPTRQQQRIRKRIRHFDSVNWNGPRRNGVGIRLVWRYLLLSITAELILTADVCATGPSRCFPFFQELMGCYVVNTSAGDDSGKIKCSPALEDYYECLHHKKEVRRPGNPGRPRDRQSPRVIPKIQR